MISFATVIHSRRVLASLLFLWLGGLVHASPSISSFSPTNGPPGTVITIKGAGFSTTTNVVFNGSVPTLGDFTVVSDGSLLVVVPIVASSGTLTVATTSGSATSAGSFQAAPVITSFSPPNGANPTQVYIDGANFINSGTNVTKVTFSGASPVTGTVTASTVVEATVPIGAVTGPITVTTSAGIAVSTNNFIASSTPSITGFSPPFGAIGSTVTISGWNFYNVSSVKIGGVAATGTVTSQTQISATVPTGATTGPISVTTASGTATTTSNFLTGSGPVITGFSPAIGTLNSNVMVYGLNLTAVTNVTFNGVKEYITGYGTGYIQVDLNTPTSTGLIKVMSSPTSTFTTSSNFIYTSAPYVTGFNPPLGGPGITVYITGFNFTGATSVKFGNTAASFYIVADTEIAATVPNGAITDPIYVNGSASGSNFLVEGAAPIITSFAPTNAVQGSVITINGANFTNLTSPVVQFGGVTGTYTTPTSTTVLYGTVPVGAMTGPISVKNSQGAGTSSALLYLQPWISNATPSGIVNSSLTLTGRNLTNTSVLTVGGVNYSFTNSPVKIVATVPSNAVTGSIIITSPGGVFINPTPFTVLPKIYSFTPALGPAGTVVTISGTSLFNVTSVLFNGTAATPYNIMTNQLQVAVPSGATPGYITVVTAGGNDVSSNIFTATRSSTVLLTKTVNPSIAGPGTNVTYTLFLTNEGPSTVSSVSVTDNIPNGFTYISSASSIGTTLFTNNMVIATVGILASNSSATITVNGNAANAGALTNTADLGFAEGNTIYGNNYAFVDAYFLTPAQRTLSIGKLGGSAIDVTWPVSVINFRLQINTNLDYSNGWQTAPFVFVTNGVNEYTNSRFSPPDEFFRLLYP